MPNAQFLIRSHASFQYEHCLNGGNQDAELSVNGPRLTVRKRQGKLHAHHHHGAALSPFHRGTGVGVRLGADSSKGFWSVLFPEPHIKEATSMTAESARLAEMEGKSKEAQEQW